LCSPTADSAMMRRRFECSITDGFETAPAREAPRRASWLLFRVGCEPQPDTVDAAPSGNALVGARRATRRGGSLLSIDGGEANSTSRCVTCANANVRGGADKHGVTVESRTSVTTGTPSTATRPCAMLVRASLLSDCTIPGKCSNARGGWDCGVVPALGAAEEGVPSGSNRLPVSWSKESKTSFSHLDFSSASHCSICSRFSRSNRHCSCSPAFNISSFQSSCRFLLAVSRSSASASAFLRRSRSSTREPWARKSCQSPGSFFRRFNEIFPEPILHIVFGCSGSTSSRRSTSKRAG